MRIILLLLTFFALASAHAEKFSTDGQWLTTESKHFRYHYLAENEHIVQRLYHRAESIHESLSEYFAWQPGDKTDVVLTDKTDFTNANARVIPTNRIVLFLAPPNDIAGLEDFDLWIELIFLHEYTHILHLDKADGFPLHLRRAFGRHYLLFPNMYLPRWITEGLATHLETDLKAKIGRGQSNYISGLMRMEVESGIKSLGQITLSVESWPQGVSWYLYGVYFFQFIEEIYGKEKLHEYLQHQSDFPIPYLIDIPFYQTFGKTTYFVWQEFEKYLINKFSPEILDLKKQGLVEGRNITQSGLQSGFSRAIDDKQILFIQNDGFTPRALWRMNTETHEKSHIRDIYGGAFDFHPQKGVLMPQFDISKNINVYFDLYIISEKTGKQQRLTHNARYGKASWNQDGSQIAAVKTKQAKHRLDLLSSSGEFLEILWESDHEVYLGDIDWSPNENKIVAAVWRKPQGWNIEIFDLSTKRWTAITNTPDIEGQASFSADGKHVIYSADYDGVYNIYSQNIDTQKILKHSNVLGGAFHPSFMPNNTLIYAGLSGKGFDVFQTSQTPLVYQEKIANKETLNVSRAMYSGDKPSPILEHKHYSALKGLIPKWWQPIVASNGKQLGFFTSAVDPLGWNYTSLAASYNSDDELPYVDLLYIFQKYRFDFSLGYTRSYFYKTTTSGLKFDLENTDSLSSTLSTSILKNNYRLGLATGMDYKTWTPNDSFPQSINAATTSATYIIAGLRASFSNFKSASRAVTLQNGFSVDSTYEKTYRSYSSLEGNALMSSFFWASPALQKTIFRMNAEANISSKGDFPFALFGSEEYRIGNSNEIIGGSRSTRLRGYPLNGFTNGRFGDILQFASLEWRFPVSLIETGLILPPIGFNKLTGNLFAEAGRAWFRREQSIPGFSKSIGAELSLETTLLYRAQTEYRVGIAKGLDAYGELQPYLVIGIRFW